MPPSSRRRGRKREAETRRLSDAEVPDSSPSRPAAKKRRANNAAAARPIQPATPEQEIIEEEDAASEGEPATSTSRDIAEEVIRHLAVAKEPVSVAIEWSNTNIERDYTDGVTAFAKVAGRDWTYYVKQLSVQIGRPSDAVSRQSTEAGARSSPAHTSEDSTAVHIDLGPNKLISRLHAELFYDNKDEKWHVIVNGRNGVRVNDRALRRGQQTIVTSGDVVEIAGTQMMFVTAEDPAVVHPMFVDRMREGANGEDVQRWNAQPHAHPEASPMNPVTTPIKNEASAKPVNRSQVTIAPALTDHIRQATPIRSPRKATESSARSKKSPPYGRGVMLETTEQINYALDSNKELKPPCSYATLIANAILSTEDEMLTLSGIYQWIQDNFAFYRHANSGWQNSIRHNLSLNKAFEKIPRRTDEPGKGMKWRIVPEARPAFVDKAAHGSSRGGRGSSAPNSPAGQEQMNFFGGGSNQGGGHDYQGFSQARPNFKASPRSGTPPMISYPVAANEAYTPDRGPRLSNAGLATNGLPILDDQSPLPARPRNSLYGLSDAAAGSPPTLSSSAYHDDSHNMITPAPTRHLPRLAAPSTARLPSSYMPTSSPAPFWKFAENMSTPARPLADLSPLKIDGLPGMGGLQSSSPPPLANGSPSKATNGRMAMPDIEQRSSGAVNGGAARDEDDDDMGAIDLARGFQPIGSFHKQMSNAAS